MSQLSLPAPECMEPINNLVQTVIDRTKIKPKSFQVPTAVNQLSITSTHEFSLEPPPTAPFTVTIHDPIFGPIQSPVFVPRQCLQKGTSKKEKKKGKKYKNGKRNTKKNGNPSKIKTDESSAPGSEYFKLHCRAWLRQPRVQEHIQQVSFEHSINEVLIYFKSVEEKIKKVLESTTKNLSQKNLEDLSSVTKDLRYFLEELDKLYAEQNLCISEIQNVKQFQVVLEYADRLRNLFNGLTDSDIPGILEHTVDKKEEHMLCSILGLDDEIADMLIGLDPSVREHKTDEHWIHDILDQKETELDGCEDQDQIFKRIGFASAKARHLTQTLHHNPYSDHLPVAKWAKLYIEHQFKYNILLSPNCNTYNDENVFDQAYTVETSADETEDIVLIPAINTKMLNKDELGESKLLAEFVSQEEDKLEGVQYWFHGTDHKSALNIMKNGIDLSRGKEGGDYSDGNGFYLTSNYEFSHQWSQGMMRKKNTAVVIFKMHENKQVFDGRKGKSFEEAGNDWKTTVNFFRKKKDYSVRGMTQKKGKDLVRLPYVFGPISLDGRQAKNPDWDPKPRNPRVYELCIKDDLMADDFYDLGKNIHKTIFFH